MTARTYFIYTLNRDGDDRTFDATRLQAAGCGTPRQQYRHLVERSAKEGSQIYEIRLLREDGSILDQHTAD